LSGPALGATYAPGVVAINSRTVQGASAASYSVAGMPAASIASVFGVALADGTESAQDFPLPTTLAGATVRITDSLNVERLAPLFFASPGQINFLVPPETSPGTAIVTVAARGETAVGVLPVTETNVGLFAANADGAGAASGYVVRLKADGTRSEESISRFDLVSQRLVPRPIDLGPETDQLILVLFGTGLRHHRTPVRASIGGIEAEVLYAGPQGEFLGLDQINLRLSRQLSRRGEVDVLMVVDGRPANILKINVF
jgi:uncharacterized protein (TIGR03437 family)